MSEQTSNEQERWLDVELMGHGRIVGRAISVIEFGHAWLRIEATCPSGHLVCKRTLNPATAVYAFKEVDRERGLQHALNDCMDASHPLYCGNCGFQHSMRNNGCPACCHHSYTKVPPEPGFVVSPWVGLLVIGNAGAEAIPDAVHTVPDSMFQQGISDQQRAEAVAWAFAVHSKRCGNDVVVPPRPDFLRDSDGDATELGPAGF